jgi:hypothetical protein
VNGQAVGDAELSTANPTAGLWQIDVVLKLTVGGNEFRPGWEAFGLPSSLSQGSVLTPMARGDAKWRRS